MFVIKSFHIQIKSHVMELFLFPLSLDGLVRALSFTPPHLTHQRHGVNHHQCPAHPGHVVRPAERERTLYIIKETVLFLEPVQCNPSDAETD